MDVVKLIKPLQYDTRLVGLTLVLLELSGQDVDIEMPETGNVFVEIRHFRKEIKEALGITEEVTTKL